MSNRERNGVPTTVTSIPLVDPHAPSADPSIGDLVKDATAQVSTLVRAEVELARAEITRDVKKGLTGSVFFILALVVLFYSTFFFFFFLAELLDTWIWRWVGVPDRVRRHGAGDRGTGACSAGCKVRRIRGPQADHRDRSRKPARRSPGHDQGQARIAARPRPPAARHSRPTRRGGDVRVTPDCPEARSVGHPHRRSVASSRGARQRDSLPRRGGQPAGTATVRRRPPARPLVILLHGFGSFWWSWRHQLRGLTGARVVAVDLRGYGGSDKPPRGYDGWTLAGDTAGLVRALGHSQATLVGHADGGLVCWATSVLHPRMVRSIAVVSSPHPVALRRLGVDPSRPGPRAAAVDAALPGADLARASLTRHDADELEALVRSRRVRQMACLRRLLGDHRPHAAGLPDSRRVAHCALEYQRWAVRSQLRSEGRRFMRSMERPLGSSTAAHARRRRPVRAGRAGRPHPALRAARPLRIPRRRRTFRPRRELPMRSTNTCRGSSARSTAER